MIITRIEYQMRIHRNNKDFIGDEIWSLARAHARTHRSHTHPSSPLPTLFTSNYFRYIRGGSGDVVNYVF